MRGLSAETQTFLKFLYAFLAFWLALLYLVTALTDTSVARRASVGLRTGERVRVCEKCAAVGVARPLKPDRAHHCSVCRKCTLRMDHHCRLLANCVGHRNHRTFVCFLLYAEVGIAVALVHVSHFSLTNFRLLKELHWAIAAFGAAAAFAYTFGLAAALFACGSLLKQNIEHVLLNSNTIESLSAEPNAYNWNWLCNLKLFFGGFFSAVFPVFPRGAENGYQFPRNDSADEFVGFELRMFDWKETDSNATFEAIARKFSLFSKSLSENENFVYLFGADNFV